MIRHPTFLAGALVALLGGTACTFLSPEPDPTRFAVLASVDDLPDAPRAPDTVMGLAVGLGPIVVPEYLLRPEILTRTDGTRLVPAVAERWGEPLDRGLERVLAIDLKRALGAERIVLHPWYATERPDVQVRITLARFEREDPGRVVLRATWSVRLGEANESGIERETNLERPTATGDGAGAALGLSLALADLAREIATAWREAAGDAPR